MRHAPLLPALLVLCVPPLTAQERAMTESGRKVLLYRDGTWKPEGPSAGKADPQSAFRRPAAATEKATFNKGRFSVYFDPSLWKKAGQDTPTRQMFQHKDGDGYAVIIAERMQVTLEALRTLALSNAKNAAPDARITLEETRTVNGTPTLVLQIQGTIQGIPFTYYGYYYAGSEGCIQVLTYTSNNLFPEFKGDFQDFLNGFTLEARS